MIHNRFVSGSRYEDFFTSQKRPIQKNKPKYEDDESDDMDMDESENDDGNQVIYIISTALLLSLLDSSTLCEAGGKKISLLFNCSCLLCSYPSFVSIDILTLCFSCFL